MVFDLACLGWDAAWAGAYAPLARPDQRPARVTRVDRGVCSLLAADGAARASLGGALLASAGRDPLALPCAGDWVALCTWPDQRTTVEAVLPRRTQVVRTAAGRQSRGQVLAANLDVAAVVEPLHPAPDTGPGRAAARTGLGVRGAAARRAHQGRSRTAAGAGGRPADGCRARRGRGAGQREAGDRTGPAAPAGHRRPYPRAARAVRVGQVHAGQRAGRGDGDGHPGDPAGGRARAARHDIPGAGPDAGRRRRTGHPGAARRSACTTMVSTRFSRTLTRSGRTADSPIAGTRASRGARCAPRSPGASCPRGGWTAGAGCAGSWRGRPGGATPGSRRRPGRGSASGTSTGARPAGRAPDLRARETVIRRG